MSNPRQAQHFDRNDVALKNIAKFFYKCSSEEQDHAKQFIEYQNKRSGTVVFKTLQVNNHLTARMRLWRLAQEKVQIRNTIS